MDNIDPWRQVTTSYLPVPLEGFKVELFFRDHFFFRRVNSREMELPVWLGVQLEAFKEEQDWKRENVGEYQPNDLMQYLKKKEGT